MTKNTTFTEAIRIFSIFLGISDVQIPPETTFLALWKSFQRSNSAKTPKNRSNIGFRGDIQYFGRSILTKSEKFIFSCVF